MKGYLTAKEAAELWKVGVRQVQVYCKKGIIPGVVMVGHTYLIPDNVEKPHQVRTLVCEYKTKEPDEGSKQIRSSLEE